MTAFAEYFHKQLHTACATNEQETNELVAEGREVGNVRSKRRMLLGVSVAAVVAGTMVIVTRFGPPCVPAHEALQQSLVGLSEDFPKDLMNVAHPEEDADAVKDWLTQVSAASAEASKESRDKDLKEAISEAMEVKDPKKAADIVRSAMTHSVRAVQEKRGDLKVFVKHSRRNMKAKKSSNMEKIKIAKCVFDVLSATTTVAGVAANLNDASKTCHHVQIKEAFGFVPQIGPPDVHAKICSLNVIAVLGNLVSLATALAMASDSCATTIIPNVDAKCSAAVTGLVTATAGMAGGATLISGSCRSKGWYNKIPEDLTPHNVGSNEREPQDRRLSGDAPARQLLFGGGRGSTATHCATEISSVMWSLAGFAMNINSLGSQKTGGTCPPKDMLFGTSNKKLPGYQISEGFCTLDITGSITSMLQMVVAIELLSVNCLDVLNVRAICGAGITGMFAGASGIAQASTGVWMACDKFQTRSLKKIINLARGVDQRTGIARAVATSFNLGRRLSPVAHPLDVDEDVQELKRQFETPEAAFMSIGIDLNNATSFREFAETHSAAIDASYTQLFENSMHDGVEQAQDVCVPAEGA